MTNTTQTPRSVSTGTAGRSDAGAGEEPPSHTQSAEGHDPEEDRRRDAFGRQPQPEPLKISLSDLLVEIAEDASREKISIGDLMYLLRGRARAALILIFAFPNALPAIPGTSGILGLPLLYLTFQMMLGRLPWLPKLISERSLTQAQFKGLVDKLVPYLRSTERLLKPRLSFLSGPRAEKALGALCLILAIILTLPVPLGNMLPAIAICLIALGMLEEDGLWVLFGLLTSLVAIVVSAGVIYVIIRAVIFLILSAFGLHAEAPMDLS